MAELQEGNIFFTPFNYYIDSFDSSSCYLNRYFFFNKLILFARKGERRLPKYEYKIVNGGDADVLFWSMRRQLIIRIPYSVDKLINNRATRTRTRIIIIQSRRLYTYMHLRCVGIQGPIRMYILVCVLVHGLNQPITSVNTVSFYSDSDENACILEYS